jgi:hypothetical protein
MATRNGTDIVESTVEVRRTANGSYEVVSVVTTLEYTGCSKEFGEFLAEKLRNGETLPNGRNSIRL